MLERPVKGLSVRRLSLLYRKSVMSTGRDFKGNKAQLPAKLCAVCGRTMTWRKAWAKNWEDVRYCSEKCRRNRRESSS